MNYTVDLSEKTAKFLDKLQIKDPQKSRFLGYKKMKTFFVHKNNFKIIRGMSMNNYFLRYLSREIVLPLRISSIPSRMSFNSFGSDCMSRVSSMLSNLSFDMVIVSAILIIHDLVDYKNFSLRNYEN